MECKNCQNLKNGSIVCVKEVLRGTKCAKCGVMMFELDWGNVPWYRKLKRFITLPTK